VLYSGTTQREGLGINTGASVHLSLDAVIESMKCFPCLEKLYIKVTSLTEWPSLQSFVSIHVLYQIHVPTLGCNYSIYFHFALSDKNGRREKYVVT
jgi:hypothetical protein